MASHRGWFMAVLPIRFLICVLVPERKLRKCSNRVHQTMGHFHVFSYFQQGLYVCTSPKRSGWVSERTATCGTVIVGSLPNLAAYFLFTFIGITRV